MTMNLVAKDEAIEAIPPSVNHERESDAAGAYGNCPSVSEVHEKPPHQNGVYRKLKKILSLDVYFYIASGVSFFIVAGYVLWFTLGQSNAINEQVTRSATTQSALQKMLEDLHTSYEAYVEATVKQQAQPVETELSDEVVSDRKNNMEIVHQLQSHEGTQDTQHVLQQRIETQSQQIELLSQDNHDLREALQFGASESNSAEEKLDARLKTHGTTQKPMGVLSGMDVTALIHRAYSAFNSQQIHKANGLYQQALQLAPQNRDANLGVAAIAILHGNNVLAEDRYRHLLLLDPLDRRAFTAMLELSEDNDSLLVEMVGHIAKYKPESYILFSAMGSYYSHKAKWDLAILAFEKSIDANDLVDDYFNLAVSLDNSGNQQRALSYYRKAVDRVSLGDSAAPLFSVSEVQARIAEISALKMSGDLNP